MRRNPIKVLFATFVILLGVVVPARAGNPNCTEVDGNYIVSFPSDKKVDDELKTAPGKKISPKFKYDKVLNGFSGFLTAEQVCAFKNRPNSMVEMDDVVSKSEVASWGLDRIDEKSLPLDGSMNTSTDGTGVNAYVVDSGISSSSTDFGTRLKVGFSAIGGTTEDCDGHGTHVAGTIGGSTYGVARSVNLIPVRVLDCTGAGSWSGVIAGLNWIMNNKSTRSVANMSLGGRSNKSVNSAVQNLISAGVTVVVAAGNESRDACNYSPAGVASALTIGASTNSDKKASYSNFGKCVDIYAPGSDITSDWIGGSSATNTISGTSMATPHVTGIVARYLQLNNGASPSAVAAAVLAAKNPLGTTGLFIVCLTGAGECSSS